MGQEPGGRSRWDPPEDRWGLRETTLGWAWVRLLAFAPVVVFAWQWDEKVPAVMGTVVLCLGVVYLSVVGVLRWHRYRLLPWEPAPEEDLE